MSQSDSRFAYRARLSRTDHDLSQKFGFTCAPGQLLPIWADYATPSDAYYIRHDLTFLRTAPLIAPAMIDVLVHYETFFVPMQMIYQPFENSVFSIKPILSSQFDTNQFYNQHLPQVDYYEMLYSAIKGDSSSDAMKVYFDSFRLYDMLNLNTSMLGMSEETRLSGFPMFACAYQCVYQYYYRLDDKEEFDNVCYNLDSYYNNPVIEPSSLNKSMFQLRYRPWRFDYFTSSYRSPIVSNANTQSVQPMGVYGLLSKNYTSPLGLDTTAAEAADIANGDITTFVSFKPGDTAVTGNVNYSTAAIRQMFANEKLAMITGRTKKNYDSQVLAHYGVSVPHDVKHDISLIGADTYKLRVGEVTSLASTDAAPLGEIAGKAVAYGSSKSAHKFTAPCHGVVITLFSIEPIQRYTDTNDRLNCITDVKELPTPEYDRLGNMPMYGYEIGTKYESNFFAIQAWKERYYFSKRKMDRVTKAFKSRSASVEHTLPLNPYSAYFISNFPFRWREGAQSSYGDSSILDAYLIQPWSLNDLFLVPYVDEWQDSAESESGEDWNSNNYLAYARDPFIVDSNMKVTKVSWMSKDGEPIYD